MLAAVLHEHGAAPIAGEHPEPIASESSVLVTMSAAPISPIDLLIASGRTYLGAPALPYVPGLYGVGRTEAGERVWCAGRAGLAPGDGCLAELFAVPSDRTVPIPNDVDDITAAALGHSAIAALGALQRGGLRADICVLVLGAAGTVGQIGVQEARRVGARVIAAVRGDDAVSYVNELGADAVVDISGLNVDQMAQAFSEASGGCVDLVLDPIWGEPALAALRTLSPAGTLINLGDDAGAALSLPSSLLRSKSMNVVGWTNLSLTWEQQSATLSEVFGHAAAGEVRVSAEVIALSDTAAAWSRQAAGDARARQVIVPA